MLNDKKILLFINKKELKPTGGPVGYLYNVQTVIDDWGLNNIHFLESNNRHVKENYVFLKRIITPQIRKYLLNYNLVDSIAKGKKAPIIDVSEYDVLHFHSTYSLYLNRDSIKDYKGIVLLTSHSPKPYHLEIIEDQLTKLEKFLYKRKLSQINVIDKYAFSRADYVLFPCEDAEEPYINNWAEYTNIKVNRKSKFRYVPTGSRKCKAKYTRQEILCKYSIPSNSFVISYVGRHNCTKGYNLLKEIGEQILNRYDNVYFLIAGKEEPLKGLQHNRWIEIGWTDDPHSVIASSDLFILPNKETYFDLIMLEVLSLGKNVLASYTGGNKYFERFKEKGIFYFNSIDSAISKIDQILCMSFQEKRNYENFNLKIFEENFTMNHFMNNYLQCLSEIFMEIYRNEEKIINNK